MALTAFDDWDGPPLPSMVNPALLRETPATERGARRRSELIAAARKVFERSGYLDARLTDITKEAKCSTGSFYTYFKNKEEIFAAVLEVAQQDMLHPGMDRVPDTDDPYAVLEASNRAYLEAYRRNAKLMALLEQVANIDPVFRELRRRRSEAFIHRNARGIADLQKRGFADPGLDPMLASRALSSMVSRVAFGLFAATGGAQEPVDFEQVVYTVTRIWANGLRFPGHS
ncbi:TetR/AcrR family transcriptional regulator [Streptomyces sp. WMMB 322]|uniref:TetR/AcrR family transcriptional regulator n=1 Tax=Streptomyces sp. WMMB 322 TaxID=1286821 RepID=UPI0006E3B093|nr:TetR/AcrR family transcriptional regulator [Streptomyces sp. WMMB 322]SCK36118.1 transcriptional regulator, TetR family [Streptomyces sp. WMMB 322]